jgi:hypothetical protein
MGQFSPRIDYENVCHQETAQQGTKNFLPMLLSSLPRFFASIFSPLCLRAFVAILIAGFLIFEL